MSVAAHADGPGLAHEGLEQRWMLMCSAQLPILALTLLRGGEKLGEVTKVVMPAAQAEQLLVPPTPWTFLPADEPQRRGSRLFPETDVMEALTKNFNPLGSVLATRRIFSTFEELSLSLLASPSNVFAEDPTMSSWIEFVQECQTVELL